MAHARVRWLRSRITSAQLLAYYHSPKQCIVAVPAVTSAFVHACRLTGSASSGCSSSIQLRVSCCSSFLGLMGTPGSASGNWSTAGVQTHSTPDSQSCAAVHRQCQHCKVCLCFFMQCASAPNLFTHQCVRGDVALALHYPARCSESCCWPMPSSAGSKSYLHPANNDLHCHLLQDLQRFIGVTASSCEWHTCNARACQRTAAQC